MKKPLLFRQYNGRGGGSLSVSPAFQILCTFVSAASKLVQLKHLWETKDPGQASALTWGLSAYTCASKLQTAWCEVLSSPHASSFHRSSLNHRRRRSCLSFPQCRHLGLRYHTVSWKQVWSLTPVIKTNYLKCEYGQGDLSCNNWKAVFLRKIFPCSMI